MEKLFPIRVMTPMGTFTIVLEGDNARMVGPVILPLLLDELEPPPQAHNPSNIAIRPQNPRWRTASIEKCVRPHGSVAHRISTLCYVGVSMFTPLARGAAETSQHSKMALNQPRACLAPFGLTRRSSALNILGLEQNR